MARRSPVSLESDDPCCRHAGYYSGVGLYVKESRVLRYVLVCDDCGEEMREIATVDYSPEPVSLGS